MSDISPQRLKYRRAAERQARERTRSRTPIPDRISAALNLRGLYGPEVDIACGAQEPDVDRWEDESDPLLPTGEQVQLLAVLTEFPVEFFYQPYTVKADRLWVCGENGCELLDQAPPPPPAVDFAAYRARRR